MNETNQLIKTLEAFYDNNNACIQGYLQGVLLELERNCKGASEIIKSHSKWIGTGLEKEAA